MDKRGHERRKKSGADIINEIYGETPDAQLLVVGSVNCLRHGPYVEIGKLMQQQRASILCPSMTDFSTGRYLRQVKEAILEISAERNSLQFILMFGCQWVILSTDGELLRQELLEEHGIQIRFYDGSHMEQNEH